MNYRKVNSPLMHHLFERGVATSGRFGVGVHCAENGALISAEGQASEVFFNLGPGRPGDLLESIAVPEIRCQAVDLAKILAAFLMRPGDQVEA